MNSTLKIIILVILSEIECLYINIIGIAVVMKIFIHNICYDYCILLVILDILGFKFDQIIEKFNITKFSMS